MNAIDAILTRRTIQIFSDEPVPKSVISQALFAAIHAPNHRHTWPWRFYALGPKSREVFADILLKYKLAKANEPASDLKIASMREKFLTPAEAILFGIKKSNDEKIRREDYASLACAIQNASLYLHSQGYGSKWSTGKFENDEAVFSLIKESSEEIELAGVLWIGKPKVIPPMAKRPELESLVRYLD